MKAAYLLLMTLILLSAHQEVRADRANHKCSDLFRRLAERSSWPLWMKYGRGALLWLPRQQAHYWKSVRASKGRSLLLVERPVRHRFNYFYLLDPVVAPVTVPLELAKAKYNLSFPGTLAMTAGLTWAWASHSKAQMREEESKIPGASYLLALEKEDLIAPRGVIDAQMGAPQATIAADEIDRFRQVLLEWSKSQGQTVFLPRFREFFKIGLIRDEAELLELDRLARSSFQFGQFGQSGFCPDEPRCEKTPRDFSARVQDRWMRSIATHPAFSKKSEGEKRLLSLAFTPPTLVSCPSLNPFKKVYPDLILLARANGVTGATGDPLHALRGLSNQFDPATLLSLAIKTLERLDTIALKQEKWRTVFPGEPLPDFVNRPDLPNFTSGDKVFDVDGTGKNPLALREELDYWILAWEDPRFEALRAAYASGSNRDETVIFRLLERSISDYNLIYALRRIHEAPDLSDLCRILGIGSGAEPIDLILGAVSSTLSEVLKKKGNLSESDRMSCALDLAEVFYNYFSEEVATGHLTDEALQQLMEKCPKAKSRRHCRR